MVPDTSSSPHAPNFSLINGGPKDYINRGRVFMIAWAVQLYVFLEQLDHISEYVVVARRIQRP